MPGVVKRQIGNSEVTSDMYPEPTKLNIDSILLEGGEHACSHLQSPSVGALGGCNGQGGREGLPSRGGCKWHRYCQQ